MPDWVLSSIVTGLVTLVVTLLGVMLGNRRTLLTYHVSHDRIGITTDDRVHGTITVTVGSHPMQNLYISNVWLVNRSTRDLENLEIRVWTEDDNMHLVSEQTHVGGTIEQLKHTAEFQTLAAYLMNGNTDVEPDSEDLSSTHQRDNAWLKWWTQRCYDIPVITRGQTIRFTYMTNVITSMPPIIHMSCQKAGVRLKYKQPYQVVAQLWGVPLGEVAVSGLVVALFVGLLVISFLSTPWLVGLLCLITGLLSNVPGAAIVKGYRWLRDQVIG